MKKANKYLKPILIITFLISIAIITYIYQPNISYAIDNVISEFNLSNQEINLENVGKITVPSDSPVTRVEIREHRGYGVIANYSPTEAKTYEQAIGNTGIKDINGFLSTHLNNAYDEGLGWNRALKYNTSIYCREKGRKFPDITKKYLNLFHDLNNGNKVGGTFDANNSHLGDKVIDHVEKYYEIACGHKIKVSPIDWEDGEEIELKETEVSERDLQFDTNGKYIQHTLVRVRYSAQPRALDTVESYIFSYSLRNYYSYDRAQVANWIYHNFKSQGTYNGASQAGINLYRAGRAVDELKNPTRPKMSVTTDTTLMKSTGTVIDGANYKVGPILMNDYQYGWCNEAKDFSGELICGIIEAKVELDNGKTITLTKDNFSYFSQDTNRTTFVNEFYESPSLHGYEYPTPNSVFYISIPISECAGASKINKVIMKFKYTTADGSGGDLTGYMDDLEWTGTKGFDYEKCTYECTNNEYGYECKNDGLSWDKRSAFPGWSSDVNLISHTSICGETGYCERGTSGSHTHCPNGGSNYCGPCLGHSCNSRHSGTCDCELAEGESCSTDHSWDCGNLHYDCNNVSRDYCKHGHSGGVHSGTGLSWGAPHNDICYGKIGPGATPGNGTFCPKHGATTHRSCYEFHWEVTAETKNVRSQYLMYISDAQVYENTLETYLENIPLVANVEINKYVYDTNHIDGKQITNYDSTMQAGDFRSTMDEATKKNNPVYAEFGDYITFKIVVENNSAFGVKVIASDILPPDTRFDKAVFSVNGGAEVVLSIEELEKKVILINANSKASFTITLQIESLEGTYTNIGKLVTRNDPNDPEWIDYVRTIDDNGPIVVIGKDGKEQTKWTSEDSYKLNDYDLSIDKYVSSYDALVMDANNKLGFTANETTAVGKKFFNNPSGTRDNFEDDVRYGLEDGYKYEHPFEVEKTEKVVYSIRLTNNDEEINQGDIPSGGKQGTQVRPTRIRENFDNGLKYEMDQGNVRAVIFGADGKVKNDNVYVTEKDLGNNSYEYYIGNETILDPGDMMIFFVTVEIEKSNMFLPNLENSANFTVLTNINDNREDRVIYEKPDLDTVETDRNINPQEDTKEYVKQKDLVLAGKVFIDEEKDGIMNPETAENRLDNVVVSLYRVDGNTATKVGETHTKDNNGEHGFYTFERVDKANDKKVPNDNTQTGNGYYIPGGYYEGDNDLYEYYIEFEYDGTSYKATEVYGGRKEEVNPNYGDNNITDKWLPKNDGKDNNSYITDSNAYEFTDVRKEYDKQFETMGYNKAYYQGKDVHSATEDEIAKLTYTKTGHESILDIMTTPISENDPKRAMRARTFIRKEVIPSEDGGFKDKGVNESLENTHTLWLYKTDTDEKLPETEYLKYINLGLVEREDVNVSLTKDLYSITTTINGEQITYDYNQNGVKNNEILIKDDGAALTQEDAGNATGTAFDETNGKYIDNEKYELELYESDYNYRVEQYEHKAVQDYKTKYSELNIEVTFRMTITNEKITNDEASMEDTDREVIVTIDEVADYYDKNFVEYTDALETKYKEVLNDNGNLEDTDYPMMTQEQVDALSETEAVTVKIKVPDPDHMADDPSSNKLIDKKLEVVKAWYYKEGEETPTGLKVTNDSNYNPEVETLKKDMYEADGYRKLYIRGFNKVQLHEGESVDIFVRYIVDKEAADAARNILNLETTDTRNLKIKEEIKDRLKDMFGRGTLLNGETGGGNEGIAEISAYSTWYQDYNTDGSTAIKNGENIIPAGLIDKNSNPDNLGDRDNGMTDTGKENMASIDNVKFYEDDTYKTGITFTVPKPEEPDPDDPPPPPPDPEDPTPTPPPPDPEDPPAPDEFIRRVYGKVWDDARSTPTEVDTTKTETQFSGDGYLDTNIGANTNAKQNENVNKNYKGADVTESKDIEVRNARVDLIEIVQIGDRYYEEVMKTSADTVHQYTTRTNDNGEYVLYGFKPGYYIVRFGYGDYPEDNNQQIIDDMAIFNGQDYKSTQYTSALDTDDEDTVIAKMEKVNNNDARDDEIDRLGTISYSEIMINRKAEVLRGNYIKDDETDKLVKELLDNTAMNAETVKFIVKPEKMTSEQTKYYNDFTLQVGPPPKGIVYNDLTNMMNNHIHNRRFTITNVNLGIEYRPETQVNLTKEIDNITLTTSNNELLLKIYVDTIITKDAAGRVTNRVHVINKEKSIGIENTQFLTNEYEAETKGILEELTDRQGFVYINMDEEILQGSTITIQYRFTAENDSEIDRIGKNLDELRFKYNDASKTTYKYTGNSTFKDTTLKDMPEIDEVWNNRFGFISKALVSDKIYKVNGDNEIIGTNSVTPANTDLYDTEYTGSGTANNVLVREMYRLDENNDIYRIGLKRAYDRGSNVGYYGRYLGDYYYTGQITDNDEIAQIKFDKILDYVDNDLVFKATENNTTNGYWGTTTAEQLKDGGYLSSLEKRNSVFDKVPTTGEGEAADERFSLLDKDKVSFDSIKGTEIIKTNLAVSISDRTKDGEDTSIKNQSISRFLTPLVYTPPAEGEETLSGISETLSEYSGQVMITESKMSSQEAESKDMTYENIAEIIQFTVTNGRRTNFITTIGNAKISEEDEWSTSTKETDTSAAERITFTPPTGLTRTDRVIKDVVETTSKGLIWTIIPTAIIAVIVIIIRFVIVKIKKRPIK